MKMKLLAAVAALSFATSPAWAMDCCKDGKCSCCANMGDKKDGEKPAPKM